LKNRTRVYKAGESAEPIRRQETQQISEALRNEWGDGVMWDTRTNAPVIIDRDQVGTKFAETGIVPALDGTYTVTTVDGKQVQVRPHFSLVQEYLKEFDAKTVSELTWAPETAIVSLARQIADNPGATLLTTGIGPNHFFNADQKDRAIFLLGSLTRNIGNLGGTPGAYAGNYRTANFNGLPQYIQEDPFNITLDPDQPVKIKSYAKAESAHYYNYGDRPLRVGNKNFTGLTHMPTPTKFMWFANSNSLLGNAKGAYDVIHNTLPKIETIVVNEWWWTMSCEYADVVFGVDSWGEFKHPDMAGSVTNPFVSIFPRTPLGAGGRGEGNGGGDRRPALRGLLEVHPRRPHRCLSPAHRGRQQQSGRLPLRRAGEEGQPGGADAGELPHLPAGGRLGADQRERALVHQDRAAGVLPRRGRVHRVRREHDALP
jgi:nitrate reductase alpha subunit